MDDNVDSMVDAIDILKPQKISNKFASARSTIFTTQDRRIILL